MAAAGGKGAGSAPARSTCGRLQLCYMVSNPEVLATYLAEVGTSILFISGEPRCAPAAPPRPTTTRC